MERQQIRAISVVVAVVGMTAAQRWLPNRRAVLGFLAGLFLILQLAVYSKDASAGQNGVPSLWAGRPKFVKYYSGQSGAVDEGLMPDCLKIYDGAVTICVHANGTDIVSDALRRHGSWETDLTAMAAKVTQMSKKGVFVDVGANLGVHALAVAAMGEDPA